MLHRNCIIHAVPSRWAKLNKTVALLLRDRYKSVSHLLSFYVFLTNFSSRQSILANLLIAIQMYKWLKWIVTHGKCSSIKTIAFQTGRHHLATDSQLATAHYCCCDLSCNVVITNSDCFGCECRLDEVCPSCFFSLGISSVTVLEVARSEFCIHIRAPLFQPFGTRSRLRLGACVLLRL